MITSKEHHDSVDVRMSTWWAWLFMFGGLVLAGIACFGMLVRHEYALGGGITPPIYWPEQDNRISARLTLFRGARDVGRALTPTFKAMLVLLCVDPWISQHLARVAGFQPYTLVLVAIGAYQIFLAKRMDSLFQPDMRRIGTCTGTP